MVDRQNWSRNVTWAFFKTQLNFVTQVCGKGSKKGKRKETPSFDKRHICPDHQQRATPNKVVTLGGILDVGIR